MGLGLKWEVWPRAALTNNAPAISTQSAWQATLPAATLLSSLPLWLYFRLLPRSHSLSNCVYVRFEGRVQADSFWFYGKQDLNLSIWSEIYGLHGLHSATYSLLSTTHAPLPHQILP